MRWLGLSSLCAAMLWAVLSSFSFAGSLTLFGVGVAGWSPSCSQSSTFLAYEATNNSGNPLTLAQKQNYDQLICGLVTDGSWSAFDVIYIWAAPDSTSMTYNLVNPGTNTAVVHGSVVQDPNIGITGDHTAAYIDTQFNPSTGTWNYKQNAATVGACAINQRQVVPSAPYETLGAYNGTGPHGSYASLYWTGPQHLGGLNLGSNPVTNSNAVTSTQGLLTINRTASTGYTFYVNGSAWGAITNTSATLPNLNFFLLSYNNVGTPSNYSGDTYAYTYFGALSAAQIVSSEARFLTFLTNINLASGC